MAMPAPPQPNQGHATPNYSMPHMGPPPPPQPQQPPTSSPPSPPQNYQQQQSFSPPQSSHSVYQQQQMPGEYSMTTDAGGQQKETGDSFNFRQPDPFYSRLTKTIYTRYQLFLDSVTPHKKSRWTFSLVTLLIFMLRIVMAQGWYVICYGLSIYYLNLFIGFLSPKIDPAFAAEENDFFDDMSDSGPMLPTRANDEFRPFIRRLPEFKFWQSATTATLISLFLTMFEVFDLPVFWPILLLYFILLFISTMRQQIRHMIKYNYVPWSRNKKRYGGKSSGDDPAKFFSTTI